LIGSTRHEQNLRQDELARSAGGLRFIIDLEAGKPKAQVGKGYAVLQTLSGSVEILIRSAPSLLLNIFGNYALFSEKTVPSLKINLQGEAIIVLVIWSHVF
jgi:hypothetical protein